MPGQATITINDNQWGVSLATTYAELTTGLSGVASLPPGTGMLFDLGYDQSYIQIDMSQMLFPLDIIFINSTQGVVGVLQDVQPGEEVYFQATTTPGARYFLEVNAGEAEGIEVGDDVSITNYQPAGALDLSSIISFAVPLVLIGFVSSMVGGMASMVGGSSSSSSEVRRLGRPRTEEERAKVHEEFYGTKELPPRGTGLGEREESTEGRRLGEPKATEERRETHERRYGTRELPKRGKGLERLRHSVKHPELVEPASVASGCVSHAAEIAYKATGAAGKSLEEMTPISPLFYAEFDADIEGMKQLSEFQRLSKGGITAEIIEQYRPKAIGYLMDIKDSLHELDTDIAKGDSRAAFNVVDYIGSEYGDLQWLENEATIEAYEKLSGEKVTREHHSMWLTLEQRKELEKKSGAVAVRWAEEATRPGDIKGVEAAAEYYYKKLKEVFGLGHLSPELSEEQIVKLREVLGLTPDVAEILKIHREKGYVQ